VSEGRDAAALSRFAEAVRAVPGARLLDVHADPDHHRSVFTFVGAPEPVLDAALRLAAVVLETVDMRAHRGMHPRLGAVDVLPFVPLRGLALADAVAIARRAGAAVGERFGVPVYFYGAAARGPARRALRAGRAGEYEGLAARLAEADWAPDAGPARFDARRGGSAVGAREVLVAYNVWLDSSDLDVARAIARAVRESSGGLPGVQALGVPLPSRGLVQVSMNLVDPRRTGLGRVWDAVKGEARRRGVRVARGELVGLAPRVAFEGRAPAEVGLGDLDATRYLDSHLPPD
jgi:glutamate formiminotransferase